MKQLYVIKIGGNIIDDDKKMKHFLDEFSSIRGRKILVHGGGKLATELAERLGIEQQLIDGRRITDAETLKVVTMVYAGYINKNLVAGLQARGTNALGMSGADGNLLVAHQRKHENIDYGFVGDLDKINTSFIENLLEQDISVVISPITHDGHGQLLNTNADTIAQEIACALCKNFEISLIYSFEKNGVLADTTDENSVITHLTPSLYNQLKKDKKITAGMIPKLDNAFTALQSGVKKVIIGKAEKLKELINGHSGTSIEHE